MRKRGKNIIPTLLLILTAPFADAQQTLRMPSIELPLIAQRNAGRYVAQLEKLQRLLKEGKAAEFYEESSRIFGSAHGGVHGGHKTKIVQGGKPTKEEYAALEWIFYYRLAAPLLSHEQIEMHGKMFSNEDYLLKIEACERLCRENTKEVAEMFAIDEGRLLRHRVETITASLAFLNKLSLYAKDESFHKKEDALLWKKFSDGEKANTKKMRAQGRNVDNLSPEGALVRGQLGARESRRSHMRTGVDPLVSLCMDDYIRKLVACFPKQGRVVQEYVKKTGFHVSEVQEAAKKMGIDYPPELHLALLLRRAIERDKDTEWVFTGLPSNDKIDAMVQKTIRDFNEKSLRE